jgi:Mrp family chromosome partitioning ATPase
MAADRLTGSRRAHHRLHHSFRGGTGKSNMTANVAALLAQSGKRVGVIDADIQSPRHPRPLRSRGS